MSNLALYMIGAVLVAGAVAIGANRLGVSNFWIAIVILVILGAARDDLRGRGRRGTVDHRSLCPGDVGSSQQEKRDCKWTANQATEPRH